MNLRLYFLAIAQVSVFVLAAPLEVDTTGCRTAILDVMDSCPNVISAINRLVRTKPELTTDENVPQIQEALVHAGEINGGMFNNLQLFDQKQPIVIDKIRGMANKMLSDINGLSVKDNTEINAVISLVANLQQNVGNIKSACSGAYPNV